jgi:hypothetical protein
MPAIAQRDAGREVFRALQDFSRRSFAWRAAGAALIAS